MNFCWGLIQIIPYPHQKAKGTSVASAACACTFGAIAYATYGWNAPLLPKYSLGYVYMPVFCWIALGILIGTPLGYKLSERLHPTWLKYFLAVLVTSTGVFALVRVALG